MASLADLREQRRKIDEEKKKLDKQIAEAEAKALDEARGAVADKIYGMSEDEKERILSMLEHECPSCGRGYAENGYDSYRKHWNCRKCMMQEILDGDFGGRFDFKFTVDIFEVIV